MLALAERLKDDIVRIRRDLHQHPELGFQEVRTAGIVAKTLADYGLQNIRTEVGRTGVTVEFGSSDGPVIGLRADMDALPIQEQTNLPFQSQTKNTMHACGHDCHTAMLLGAARLLADDFRSHGDDWKGRVRLLFQPCEEKFDEHGVSGATAMIDDQALAGLSQVVALHIISTMESGQLQFCDGYAMASVDTFEATISGDGGHGAYPHLGRDPIFMLSSILPALYGIASRRISPMHESVVSLGQVHAGSTDNVIPKEVFLHGTIRSFDETVRQQLWEEVEQALCIAEAMGGSCEFELLKGYPSLVNDAGVNQTLRQIASSLGVTNVIENEPFGMGGEDFAYMVQQAPGAMFLLGGMVPNGGAHHTPVFDIDENVLPLGTAMLARAALQAVGR